MTGDSPNSSAYAMPGQRDAATAMPARVPAQGLPAIARDVLGNRHNPLQQGAAGGKERGLLSLIVLAGHHFWVVFVHSYSIPAELPKSHSPIRPRATQQTGLMQGKE